MVKRPLSAGNVVCLTNNAMTLLKNIGVLTMNIVNSLLGSRYRINFCLNALATVKSNVRSPFIQVQQTK